MKLNSLLIAAASAVAFIHTASAQLVTLPTILVGSGVTSNTPAGSFVIDCRRQQNVAIEWTQTLGGAGTSLAGVSFVPSIDGTTLAASPDNNGFVLARAAAGGTATTVVTNFNVKGYNYLVLYYITNGNSQAMTNTFRYWVKPSAP
jgi:hypothetical protein